MLKKLIAILASSTAATVSAATSHHIFGNDIFSLDAPAFFTRNTDTDTFQLIAPQDIAAITASAYAKADGSLEDFCEYRYSSIEKFYKPAAEAVKIKSNHALGELREFEGTWPGESSPTYYVVSCLQVGDVYVSLTIVTTRNHYEKSRPQYNAMFESIRPGP